MDDRTQRLLQLYKEHENDPHRIVGESAYIPGVGAVILPGTQGGTLANEGSITAQVEWQGGENTPLRRRSPAERAESLAQRFWASVKDHDPAQTEVILKQLYGDAWKAGKPISYDEVKRVAVEALRLAAAKQGASY